LNLRLVAAAVAAAATDGREIGWHRPEKMPCRGAAKTLQVGWDVQNFR
jgi:hypothetical protein